MDKHFQREEVERVARQTLETTKQAQTSSQENYSIFLPPPNVTGTLHMGHGFQQTLMDILIRYHKQQGQATLFQPGTDHAGIATQMVVEQQLLRENTTRSAIGRDAFMERVWDFKNTIDHKIVGQMQKMGIDANWDRLAFSMGTRCTKATMHAFKKLYQDGLIYRGTRMVNWDPKLQTALSDLEVINSEEQGSLWHIAYDIQDSDTSLTIATTRPETLLGDVAIAVHPEDKRYCHLIGKKAIVPICNRAIEIIGDDYVDQSFGTGCLKITPAHDFNDYEIGKRHQLEPINIFNPDATLNEQAPEAYQGLDRFVAREKLLEALQAQGKLIKTQNHTLQLPRCERGNTIVEPRISMQWYLDVKKMAQAASAAVEEKQAQFVPASYKNLFDRWMEDIQDWCISRQLWWGHRIPVFYDQDQNMYLGETEEEVRAKHKLDDKVILQQETDVLDTWFTAALWPLSSLGWPEQTPQLEQFFPSSVLVTGFDIIFFWVARMLMFSLYFTKQVPFKDIYIHGLIRDQFGHKMSKSKGNVIDPIDLVEGISLEELLEKRTRNLMQASIKDQVIAHTKEQFPEGIQAHGLDAVRFTFTSLASQSRDICFDMQRLGGYRNFCNKIWNATRFVLMQTDENTVYTKPQTTPHPAQLWMAQQIDQAQLSIAKAIKNYRFDHMAQTLYELIWNHYCDWYLECHKLIKNHGEDQKAHTYWLLYFLEQLMIMLHPVMPYLSQYLYLELVPLLGRETDNISLCVLNNTPHANHDPELMQHFELMQEMTTLIRTMRSELNVKPSQEISVILSGDPKPLQAHAMLFNNLMAGLCKATISFAPPETQVEQSVSQKCQDYIVHILLEGLIDIQSELLRIEKSLAKLDAQIGPMKAKLNNANFTQKAPSDVVEKVKAQCQELQDTHAHLLEQKENLQEMVQ